MIDEERIKSYLDNLLLTSDAGDSLHHLFVVTAPAERGPLGLVDESKTALKIYGIAAQVDETERAADFVKEVVMAAAVEAHKEREAVVWAGLSQEVFMVDGAFNDDARRLHQEGRLNEHPDAAEATVVYAACADGRRWRGKRWLTGPKAGTTEDVDLLVGRPTKGEGYGADGLIRKLVGL